MFSAPLFFGRGAELSTLHKRKDLLLQETRADKALPAKSERIDSKGSFAQRELPRSRARLVA